MLYNVLDRLAADTGLHKIQKRDLLLRILQNAAKELHSLIECTKIQREVTLVVPNNKVVSLPAFIGELRGMRKHTNDVPVDLHTMSSPRYVTNTVGYRKDNWRDLGESAIMTSLNQVAPLRLKASEAENVTVKISGQTDSAARDEESVVMSDIEVTTTNLFGPTISNISCFEARIKDITIQDDSYNTIAILYTDQINTRYKIVDVSEVCWPADTSSDEALIDVLYKIPAFKLERDTDSFYAGDDYDEAWYCMSMHIFLDPQANRKQDSLSFRAKCMDLLQSAKSTGELGQIKKIQFGRNKYYNLFWPEFYLREW